MGKIEVEKLNRGKFMLPVMYEVVKKYNECHSESEQIAWIKNNNYSSLFPAGRCVMLRFPNGESEILFDIPFNINPSTSVKACMNKDICTTFLDQSGFSVPKSENFTRKYKWKNIDLYEPMIEFFDNAEKYGFRYPLIIKPANLSQGIGVVKIGSKDEAHNLLKGLLSDESLAKCSTFVIQEFITGHDYRVVVLGDKILQAYKRVPFHVVGDGKHTIKQLLDAKVQLFIEEQRDKKVDPTDPRIYECIKEAGYEFDSILEKGRKLTLQKLANLSLGGHAEDCTKTIAPYFRNMAIEAAKSLNLDMCGIDIIAPNLEDRKSDRYAIIEVNSAPGLDNYLYSDPKKQEEYIESMAKEILKHIIKKHSSINNKEQKRKTR
jgi:D-alanine-D-alanine ligase-like ATP-grasp enzyme